MGEAAAFAARRKDVMQTWRTTCLTEAIKRYLSYGGSREDYCYIAAQRVADEMREALAGRSDTDYTLLCNSAERHINRLHLACNIMNVAELRDTIISHRRFIRERQSAVIPADLVPQLDEMWEKFARHFTRVCLALHDITPSCLSTYMFSTEIAVRAVGDLAYQLEPLVMVTAIMVDVCAPELSEEEVRRKVTGVIEAYSELHAARTAYDEAMERHRALPMPEPGKPWMAVEDATPSPMVTCMAALDASTVKLHGLAAEKDGTFFISSATGAIGRGILGR